MQGVSFLHDRHVCHRDVKLENILVDSDFNIKLIDFGFAASVKGIKKGTNKLLTDYKGTENYISPEILIGKPYCGK